MAIIVTIVEKTLEKVLYAAGALIGYGVSAAGEKIGAALPAGRPMDSHATARRMSKDQSELYNLYKRLLKYEPQAEKTITAVCDEAVSRALSPPDDQRNNPLVEASCKLCLEILHDEGYFPLPEIDFSKAYSMGEIWTVTALLRRCLTFYETTTQQEKIREILSMFLYNLLHDQDRRPWLDEKLIRVQGEEVLFATPLVSLHANIAQAIDTVGRVLGYECPLPIGEPLPRLWKKYLVNSCVASGIDPSEMETTSRQPVLPTEVKGKSPTELINTYLAQTPFPAFFHTNLPFVIPLATRYSHMHILGGSGHGKTQTLQNFLLSDLAKVGEGERSVIVIDSQGDLINNILKLEAVGDILDRVVLIYPKDLKHPPALNLFDFGLDRLSGYSDVDREMLLNGAVALYEYMFGAVLGADLTAKQGVIFGYLARLLLVVPGATITTLIDFLEEPEKVRPYLPKLKHPLTRRFFDAQFFNKSFDDTRQQILYRIYDVMKTDSIARMFQNPRNKVNIFDAMNRGSLILIHTAKDLLKQEGCEILGRFFIALIAQAAQERATVPEDERTPTFVYIDEAHDYFDENIETLLEQARKYKVGMILAHQHLGQFENRQLRSSVAANTAIKLVGGLSSKDASDLSKDMNCTPELLLSMRKLEREKVTQFACFVRNHTHCAIPLAVPLGVMEEAPTIRNPHVFDALLRRNWANYCTNATDEYPPEAPGREGAHDSPLDDPEML